MTARAYNRTLRDSQAQQTRERVLDAVIAAIARQEDLAVPELARAAGVSVPTIYRYFPTRSALMDATQEAIGARLMRPKWPASEGEVAAMVPDRYAWFEENGELMRAILASPLGRDLLASVQRQREKSFGRALSRRVAQFEEGKRRAVLAIVSSLDDAHTWRQLRDGWRIPPDDAAWAARWAVETLLQQLRKEPRLAGRNRALKAVPRRSP